MKYFKLETSDPPLIMKIGKMGTNLIPAIKEAGWTEIKKEEYNVLEAEHEMDTIADVVLPIPMKRSGG